MDEPEPLELSEETRDRLERIARDGTLKAMLREYGEHDPDLADE